MREVAPDRLAELDALGRAHAGIYRDAPFVDAPELQARLRAAIAGSDFAAD